MLTKLSALLDSAYEQAEALEAALEDPRTAGENVLTTASYYRDTVIPAMEALRTTVDAMEENVSSDYWPYPTYADLMFRV